MNIEEATGPEDPAEEQLRSKMVYVCTDDSHIRDAVPPSLTAMRDLKIRRTVPCFHNNDVFFSCSIGFCGRDEGEWNPCYAGGVDQVRAHIRLCHVQEMGTVKASQEWQRELEARVGDLETIAKKNADLEARVLGLQSQVAGNTADQRLAMAKRLGKLSAHGVKKSLARMKTVDTEGKNPPREDYTHQSMVQGELLAGTDAGAIPDIGEVNARLVVAFVESLLTTVLGNKLDRTAIPFWYTLALTLAAIFACCDPGWKQG